MEIEKMELESLGATNRSLRSVVPVIHEEKRVGEIGVQQQLVALKVKLGFAKRLASADARLEDLLLQLEREADETVENLRDLARGIYPRREGIGRSARRSSTQGGIAGRDRSR